MSDHGTMDYAAHNSTYAGFVKLAKWGTIGVVALLIILAATLL